MTKKSAGNLDPVTKPHNREKALSACLFRLLGATQREAAESARVGERTLRQWEKCSWWIALEDEARARWCRGLAAKARVTLEKGIEDGDLRSARWALERLEPRLRPSVGPPEVTGLDGEGFFTKKSVGEALRAFRVIIRKYVDEEKFQRIVKEVAPIELESGRT